MEEPEGWWEDSKPPEPEFKKEDDPKDRWNLRTPEEEERRKNFNFYD